MSAAGPELPPHLLAKRKRQREENEQDEADRPSGAKRSKSPEGEKRARVIGPAAPPAPLDERPPAPPDIPQRISQEVGDEDSSDDDDDDFGPALPRGPQSGADEQDEEDYRTPAQAETKEPSQAPRTQRDEWMMVPPKQDDLAARMDPSKLRARGFNTGKSAKAPPGSGSDATMWTETPEQKRKRLADEVMGVKPTATSGGPPKDIRSEKKRAEDKAIAARVQEQRNKSLYEEHQKTHDKETEDDPSKRAFDREKDMGAGLKITDTQRREMLNKAKGFSSKFAGGSYL